MPSSPPSKAFSAFAPLRDGFSQAIAPGGQLVTLGGGATWWQDDAPVMVALPPNTPVDGAQWTADAAALRVGLGTLDLAARAWRADAVLASWNRPGPRGDSPVREVAWTSDVNHVALLLETRSPDGKRATEIAIASASDGGERGRREVVGASKLVATGDRVLVAAHNPVVLDLDAKLIAEPSPIPDSVTRVREGNGMFAALGAAGAVALIRPSDGFVVATWDVQAIDAVPVANGAVAIDFEGVVRVGCVEGSAIKTVAEAASGVRAAVVRVVGDRVVVAGAGAVPVHVARFANPCR
ncbi:MAG: hypothetical protein AB7O24_00195 [Kofleriaceae bacterium]